MGDRLTVDLEVVTPLFLGGADPAVPEVRASSFRGALRFWFRALAAERDLSELRRREAMVFGDTGRASAILVSAEAAGEIHPEEWNRASSPTGGGLSQEQRMGLGYLAFPFRQQGSAPPRRCLPPGAQLRLGLRLRRRSDEEMLRQAYAALWLLLNLGGLGTRERRGLGGLAALSSPGLDGLPPLGVPGDSPADLRRHLQEGLRQVRALVSSRPPADRAPYAVLTAQHARVVMANGTWDSWQSALGEFG